MMLEDIELSSLDSRDLFNDTSDPRVGSGRDNSTGGTLSTLSKSGTDSASLSSLGGTFVPVLIYSAVFLLVFLWLRRKCHRVYAPRTIPGILLPEDQTPALPSGWINWIKPFLQIPDTYVLNHGSLDGFFFLRFLRVLSIICFAGCCICWPVLLPIHGTGGNHLVQLDLLTIGNVTVTSRFFGHVIIAWIFFGFILFMISRECIYYINLRQAYLLSPHQANRQSSRTVLFTCVPPRFLDEHRVRKLFGDSVRTVWIPRSSRELRDLVDEREKTADRLEKAEIELMKLANAARSKQLKSQPSKLLRSSILGGHYTGFAIGKSNKWTNKEAEPELGSDKGLNDINVMERSASGQAEFTPQQSPTSPKISKFTDDTDLEYVHPYGLDSSLPDVRGSVAAQWVPASARPHHRPLANYGRRVDTIKWTRDRLKTISVQIYKLRRKLRGGDGTPMNAIFVEFNTQADAQAAYQTLAHHQPLHMSPRYIGIRPSDVVWGSLRMRWWERIIRRFLMMGLITAAVIFWSIPSAFVGAASNLKTLSSIVFLKWISYLPSVITSVLEGLLPALALSLLMAAVPGMLRFCARIAGEPSLTRIELFTQNAYFVFQVVQVFLITTMVSAASAALTHILEDPLSAKDLLSENLPKASNFYLSYILVQCLAGGAMGLVQPLQLLRHQILAKGVQIPRSRLKKWRRLRGVHWGAVYPVFTNLGVIAISYSCIAPLVLAFAASGLYITYIVYKYNLLYSFGSDLDTQGLHYPRALMHLMVGLYLAEICLIGLFALHSAFAPLLLMVLFLVFTLLVNISLNDAISPLLYNLPRTLAMGDEDLAGRSDVSTEANNGQSSTAPAEVQGGAAADYYNLEEAFGASDDEDIAEEESLDMDVINRGGIEGGRGAVSAIADWTKTTLKTKVDSKMDQAAEASGLAVLIERFGHWWTPVENEKVNFLVRWLHPEIYESYTFLRRLIVPITPTPVDNPEKYARRAYYPPEMWRPTPKLWIPRDDAHVSRQEVAHTREVIPISDHGAWLNEKGRLEIDLDAAPFKEPILKY